MRGSVWHWNSVRCGALGGAVSPDRRNRDVRAFRWSDEAITQSDVDRLIANTDEVCDGRLHVLFTHDAPAQATRLMSGSYPMPRDVQEACDLSRRMLAEAVDRTQPACVVHGHWHRANREHVDERTEIIRLAEDGKRDHLAVVAFSDPPQVQYQG